MATRSIPKSRTSIWICTVLLCCVSSLGSSRAASAPALPRIVPIRDLDREIHPLAKRAGILDSRVHNLRIAQVVAFHEHPVRPELVAILRGSVRVRGLRSSSEGAPPIVREEVLGVGDLVAMPPTAVHEFSNVGAEPAWCLVFQSPPFEQNDYLDGVPPASDVDFIVIPFLQDSPVRGDTLPAWATAPHESGERELGIFPKLRTRLIRDEVQLLGTRAARKTWILVVSGEGSLVSGGTSAPVASPSWIEITDGNWSLDGRDWVAVEFTLPDSE